MGQRMRVLRAGAPVGGGGDFADGNTIVVTGYDENGKEKVSHTYDHAEVVIETRGLHVAPPPNDAISEVLSRANAKTRRGAPLDEEEQAAVAEVTKQTAEGPAPKRAPAKRSTAKKSAAKKSAAKKSTAKRSPARKLS